MNVSQKNIIKNNWLGFVRKKKLKFTKWIFIRFDSGFKIKYEGQYIMIDTI